MTKTERSALKRRLSAIQKRAEAIEDEACKILNDLVAGLIPATPDLTEEATYQLKNHSLRDLSRSVGAVIEVATQ